MSRPGTGACRAPRSLVRLLLDDGLRTVAGLRRRFRLAHADVLPVESGRTVARLRTAAPAAVEPPGDLAALADRDGTRDASRSATAPRAPGTAPARPCSADWTPPVASVRSVHRDQPALRGTCRVRA
ncbi:hypothetical protein [Streptomyces sp. NPDC002343]